MKTCADCTEIIRGGRTLRCRPCAAKRKKQTTQSWKIANKDRCQAIAKEYRKLPHRKLAQRAMNLTVLANRVGSVGKFYGEDVSKMLIGQDYRCKLCNCDISGRFEIDHIIPISKGGCNWPHNLQLLCPKCNNDKGDKMPNLTVIVPPLCW